MSDVITRHAQPRRVIRYFFTLALTSAVALPMALAQTDTGRITGTVLDSSGAVLPGATLTLTDPSSGLSQTATADKSGLFTFNAIKRGHYRIEAADRNFTTNAQEVDLQVSQVLSMDFRLTPGSSTTTVQVTDAAPVVNLATSSTGTVLEAKQIVDLPLNGRNFTQLALLVPGVTRGGYGSAASGSGQNSETFRNGETGGAALSVNGLRQQANNFELDGLDNNDALVNTIVFFPPVEATQEFRVTTSVAPAEFGRAGGAIIQSSIKSGTNSFHGSAFFFDRDAIFDANPNYFSAPGNAKPTFHRTQFGGTLGGPIWKNRVFLFGDYQGLRQKQPNGAGFHNVPTALMRGGDFSELLGPNSTVKTSLPSSLVVPGCTTYQTFNPGVNGAGAIYDPLTCAQFNGNGTQPNVIPAARLTSQAAQTATNYLKAFPLPNVAGATTSNNYYVNTSQTQRFDDFDVRMDANITQKDSVFARYSYGQDVLTKQSTFVNLPSGFGAGSNPTHPRGVAAGYTHIFSPNLVNEFRYGYLRPYYAYINPDEGIPVSANLGILNANRTPLLGGGAAINGGGDLEYTGDGGPYTVPQKSNQFVDSITWTHGPHTFRFGGSVEKREVEFFQGNNAKGQFDYSGRNFTGFADSDMLAAFVGAYNIGVASSSFDTKNWEMGYFVQDDWKATRRLTLNLGIRYDLFTYPYEQNNEQSDFNLSTAILQVAGTNGVSRSIIQTNFRNFAPRIGFAYTLNDTGTSAIRGGYGLFYFLDRGGVGNQLSENPDWNGSASYLDTNGYRITFSGQNAPPTGGTLPPPNNNNATATQALPLPIFGASVDRNNPINAQLLAINPHLPTPTVQQWNLQFQQQIDHATSVTVAYVGTTSNHLPTYGNINDQILGGALNAKLYPALSSITYGFNEGAANYNGLQVFLNRQLSNNLQITAAYTYSHTLDNSDGAFATGAGGSATGAGARLFVFPGRGFNLTTNYGNSAQDQRNVFNFSGLATLPFGRGQRWGSHIPRVLDYAVGGWQLNTIVTLASGQPFDVTSGQKTVNGQTISITPSNRVDQIGHIHYTKSLHQWFDPSSFQTAPFATTGSSGVFTRPGTLGRDQLFGPSYRDMDLSLFKNFPIARSVVGQLRAEAFNISNTPQFTNPNGSIDTPAEAGVDNGATAQINATRIASERQLELAFRLTF